MREFQITLAGQAVGIRSLYDEVFHLCQDYLSEGQEVSFRI